MGAALCKKRKARVEAIEEDPLQHIEFFEALPLKDVPHFEVVLPVKVPHIEISPHSLQALKKLRSKFAASWKECGMLKKKQLQLQGPLIRWQWMVERVWRMKEHDFNKRFLKDLKDDRRFKNIARC